MKIVLSSFGSSGDFNPCLGLGRALVQKGADVIFLSNPYYQKKITDAGLRFHPAGEYFDVFNEIKSNPAYLHPRKGPPAVWKMVLRSLPVMYQAMSALIEQERPDFIACHTLEYGGMLAAVNRAVPYATLTPTPIGWFNVRYPPYVNFHQLPRWVRCSQAHLGRWIFRMAFRHNLMPLCRKEGIPPAFESIDTVFAKARLNLGLWSLLLRDKVENDPPHSTICGFVRDQHVCDWDTIPDDIRQLFDSKKKPIVAGLGSTASLHGDQIYRRTAEVCKQLGRPCLLVGKDLAGYADPERGILTVDFAPYGWVFPRAAIVIHHGGLNTTAETLRAGVPAVIIPHGYDQFDNAIYTQHAGLSKRLKPAWIACPAFGGTIRSVLNDTQMHERAEKFANQLKFRPDGGQVAADCIMQAVSAM